MNNSAQQLLRQHGLTTLIAALVVALLAVIGFETQWGSSLRPLPVVAAGQQAKAGDTALLPAFGLPTLDAGFKETADRPLFLPARRPVPVSGTGQTVMKKGQFRLAGTVVNKDLPYAFLVEVASGKGLRVAKGAEIVSSGITVDVVDASRVVLKQGEETEELTLRTAASPPPPIGGLPGPGSGQKPPPSGVVVGPVPTANQTVPAFAGAVPVGPGVVGALSPQPGSSALPGFVQSPPGSAPNAAPASPAEAAAANQRRRRFPVVPPQ